MMRSLQLLLLVVAVACYRNTESGAEPCTGTRFVVVSNNWNRAIDVWTYQNGQRTVIGTVTAGSTGQFPVSAANVSYSAEGGGSSGAAAAPMGATSPIQTRYICR
jgi:hypothetical protein